MCTEKARPEPAAQLLALDLLEKVASTAACWRITLLHMSLNPRGWQELAIRWEDMSAQSAMAAAMMAARPADAGFCPCRD